MKEKKKNSEREAMKEKKKVSRAFVVAVNRALQMTRACIIKEFFFKYLAGSF